MNDSLPLLPIQRPAIGPCGPGRSGCRLCVFLQTKRADIPSQNEPAMPFSLVHRGESHRHEPSCQMGILVASQEDVRATWVMFLHLRIGLACGKIALLEQRRNTVESLFADPKPDILIGINRERGK